MKGQKSPQALNDVIAGRPDMADYAGDAEGYKTALSTWAGNVEAALDKGLAQTVNDHTDTTAAGLHEDHAVINQKLDEIKNTVEKDLEVALKDLDIDTKNLKLSERIDKYAQRIDKNVRDIKTITKNIRNLVLEDIALDRQDLKVDLMDLRVDIDTNHTAHEDLKIDYDTNETAHRNNVDINAGKVEIQNSIVDAQASVESTVRSESDRTNEHIDDTEQQIIDTDNPLYVKRGVKAIRDAVGAGAKAAVDFVVSHGAGAIRASQSIADYVQEHQSAQVTIPGFGIVTVAQLEAEGLFNE